MIVIQNYSGEIVKNGGVVLPRSFCLLLIDIFSYIHYSSLTLLKLFNYIINFIYKVNVMKN